MTDRLVAGVDCSTQSTKVLVVDVESGEVVATGRHRHRVTGTGGARETDPDQWWQALARALAQTGCAGQIGGISIAGQQHGLVVLGDHGRPLRPAMLWNDTRSAKQAVALRDALGGADVWAARIGVVPVASFTISKWAWLRETEPHVADAVQAVRLPHDHLTERLCGHGVTDRGDASGTGWWSSASGDYAAEVLELDGIRLDRRLLPRVAPPTAVVGEVSRRVASELGLAPGTVVGPGTGDNMAAAMGLGLQPGTPVISLGTSGTAYAVSRTRTVDPSGTVAGFADATGRFLPLAATLNCTLAVDRFATLLGLDREDIAPSSGGCVVLPYLDGERTPDLPLAAGSVVGLRHQTTGQQILRAAYEGAMASLLQALDAIESTGVFLDPEAPITLIGGGARGSAWPTIVQQLSGRPTEIPSSTQQVALGAVQATAVLHDEDPVAVASRWGTRRGTLLEARPRADEDLARIPAVRANASTPSTAAPTDRAPHDRPTGSLGPPGGTHRSGGRCGREHWPCRGHASGGRGSHHRAHRPAPAADAMAKTADACRNIGGHVHTVTLDVTQVDAVDAAFHAIIDRVSARAMLSSSAQGPGRSRSHARHPRRSGAR